MDYLYRGVSAKHPAWFWASIGMVVPGNPGGNVTVEQHNLGGYQAQSPFTSWMASRTRAEFHRDKDGPGGLLLRVEAEGPGPGDTWSWEWSADLFFEEEILLYGIRIGVEVIV